MHAKTELALGKAEATLIVSGCRMAKHEVNAAALCPWSNICSTGTAAFDKATKYYVHFAA